MLILGITKNGENEMKTKMSLLTIFTGLILVVSTNAFAAEKSVVTTGEQNVIAAAQAAAGSHLAPNHTIQASNYMKTVDISDANAAIIVKDINEIVALVKSTGVNTANVTSLDELLALLPVDVAEKVAALAAEIDALTPGFTLEQLLAEEWLTDANDKPVLANTGVNYTSSLIALSSLFIVVAGAAVVMNRSKQQA